MAEGCRLSDIFLSFFARFESLVVTPYAYYVRLGLFLGDIDAGDVTQPDTVEYFRFLDRGENGLYLRWRARWVIGSASAQSSTASMYLACFLASQIASIRRTRVRKKSSRTASMASEESVGRRAEAREVNCVELIAEANPVTICSE